MDVINREEFQCGNCTTQTAVWFDDDGVIRCDACHLDVATKWGTDYDQLI